MGRRQIFSEKKADPSPENPAEHHILPTTWQNGKLKTKGIEQEGESGRAGFHPFHFLHVAWQNGNHVAQWLNILWPIVPVAIASHWVWHDRHATIFTLNYIAMIPAANMLGFAGQEFARKLPRVFGILAETALGSVVEIILFMVLTARSVNDSAYVPILQAAILGSIMTNLLLCLGCCFLVGGIRNKEDQRFHPVISETGSGILLVAGFALLIPSAFYSALQSLTVVEQGEGAAAPGLTIEALNHSVRNISNGTSIILVIAFIIYIIYCAFSAHSVFDEILAKDEAQDQDRQRDLMKKKFTMTECIIAIIISLTCVTLSAVFLVNEIHYIVEERGVPDAFLGFILVPLVEKLAEHVTAIDEAYDNQMNFALYHCIGPSIQTALFNGPLSVIVGWGLGTTMDLNFEIFMVVILVLSILVVGSFLRDGSSNYLEGALLIVVYAIIALSTWYYPNPAVTTGE